MLNVIAATNSAACFAMLGYMFVISVLMPNRGMWLKRMIVIATTIALGLQVIAPMVTWLPQVAWHGVILHVSLAGALLIWRREAMAFIRCQFVTEKAPEQMRRSSDWSGGDTVFGVYRLERRR